MRTGENTIIEGGKEIRKRAHFLSEPEDNEVLKENPINLDKG